MQTLIDYFETTAASFPTKLAVSDCNSNLSFEELRLWSRIIATKILKNNKSINKPIVVLLPKCNMAIASFLGILYTGNIFTPLDLNNPEERLEILLKNLDSDIIITDTENSKKLKTQKKTVINIDNLNLDSQVFIPLNYTNCIDTDPAYLMHTSGSKGVLISHKSICNHINCIIDTFNINENEIIGNQANFVFDNSIMDIFLMAFTGATIHLISQKLLNYPIELAKFLRDNDINYIYWVPTVLVNMANKDALNKTKLPSLKKVLFCGEVMPTKQINYWIKRLNKSTLFANLYGPTETTICSSYYIIKKEFKDSEVLPIGKPFKNQDLILLNEKNHRCEIGEHGEICIRGTSLALGYWNDFKKTKEVFVQNPLNKSYSDKIYRTGDLAYWNENNEIVFMNRKDSQIKLFGYRIELGEIEHAVNSSFDSLIACVIFDKLTNQIVLFYESEKDISLIQFRKILSKVLLKYMLPTKFVRIKSMPTIASGKIDRTLLLQMISENKSSSILTRETA